jgi:hypothetical protein
MRTRARSIGWTTAIVTVAAMLMAMLAPAAGARPGLLRAHRPAHRDAGDVWVQLQSKTLHVPGTPYGWRFTLTRFEPKGTPADTWDLNVQANRNVRAGGHKVHQLHEWTFDLPAGDVTVPDDMRGVRIDTVLPDGFGSIDLRLRDLSPITVDPLVCHSTGKVVARESSRRGAWTGSFTFDPQITDPQVPDSVDFAGVRGDASRERDTGRPCPDDDKPRCTNQKIVIAFEDVDPETQVGVNLQQFARYRYAQVFQTIDDGAVRISHGVWASGDLPDPISSDAVSVTAEFGALAPFVEDDAMSWTKAVPDVQDGPKCRRAHYNLIGDLGAIDVDLDSGPFTIDVPAEGFFYAETKHPPV